MLRLPSKTSGPPENGPAVLVVLSRFNQYEERFRPPRPTGSRGVKCNPRFSECVHQRTDSSVDSRGPPDLPASMMRGISILLPCHTGKEIANRGIALVNRRPFPPCSFFFIVVFCSDSWGYLRRAHAVFGRLKQEAKRNANSFVPSTVSRIIRHRS